MEKKAASHNARTHTSNIIVIVGMTKGIFRTIHALDINFVHAKTEMRYEVRYTNGEGKAGERAKEKKTTTANKHELG